MASDRDSHAVAGHMANTDAIVAELRELADAIDGGDAYLQGVESNEKARVEDVVVQSLTLTFIPTTEYGGRFRFAYDGVSGNEIAEKLEAAADE